MYYRDRLNDDYEAHQRSHSYLKDELEVLAADAKVKRPSWFQGVMGRMGDALISAGKSMKEDPRELEATPLFRFTR
ncbi:MAG TPA: hypothetical protein VLZ89_01805 [Anaerolineales bacterium]|nr:hypothetical protein [Anaerolineales bacterium]